MRPESLFADGRGRDDRSVAIAVSCEIDDREEVAVLSILIASPREEVAGWRSLDVIGRGWDVLCAGERRKREEREEGSLEPGGFSMFS